MKILEDLENGKLLFKGKIIDYNRKLEGGKNPGFIIIKGFAEYESLIIIKI